MSQVSTKEVDLIMAAATPTTAPAPGTELPKSNDDLGKLMDKKIPMPSVPISDRGLEPQSLDELQRVARLYLNSGQVPKSIMDGANGEVQALARVALILEHARVLKIPNAAALAGMVVIRNTVCIWGDLLPALVMKHPRYGGMSVEYKGDGDTLVCECTIKRRGDGFVDEHTARFGMADAKAAGLLGKDAWKGYARDMLRRRAVSRAVRFLFPDALCGLGSADEMTDADTTANTLKAQEAAATIAALQ